MPGNSKTKDRGSIRLRLYVAGDSPNSVLARQNLAAVLAGAGAAPTSLEVIDVLEEPERSLADGVVVTPTLVKLSPPPEQRIVGNLRDTPALVAVLGLGRGDK
jgi:circadian clock protein KaiB